MWVHPPGELVSDSLVRDGVWEPLESALFLALLEDGAVVVDAGANLGYYSLLASSRLDGGGRVLAFEPDPVNLELLGRNLDGRTGVEIHGAALGACAGRAAWHRDPVNRGDCGVLGRGRPGGDAEVVVQHLDALGLERVDVLKLDTQGSETDVLRGARDTLARSPGLRALVEFWPAGLRRAGSDADALIDELRRLARPLALIDHERGMLSPLAADDLPALAAALDVGGGFCNLLLGAIPTGPWASPALDAGV